MNDLFGDEEFKQQFEENTYTVSNLHLKIREFTFHRLNANQVWPGNQIFSEFLQGQLAFLLPKKVLELGSGSGILSIFLKLSGVNVTASDCPDTEVEENILHNARENGVNDLQFLPHLWGEDLTGFPKFDLILASDILIYLKSFPALIKSLKVLLADEAVFWLNNRRRIDTEEVFLNMCREEGFGVREIFPKVFEVKLGKKVE